MGKVWLAVHTGLERKVALKVLHRNVHADGEMRARFEREAVAIGRLSHPGIVEALDFGELEDGRKFLAMEFVNGETLHALLKRTQRLGWRTVLRIGVEVADALACAHAHGIVHRDLKPDNLIVERGDLAEGTLRVLDLGLARVDGVSGLGVLSERNLALGTVAYSAPEQLRGDPADARADVYGLGAVLYRCLTGALPHPGECFADVVTRQHRGVVAHPREVYPDDARPRALDELLLRCLASDPADRPRSMARVRDALLAITRADGRPHRRGLRRAVAGAALVAAGALGGALLSALLSG